MNFEEALQAASPEPPRRPRPSHPKGYEPSVRYEAGEPAEVSLNLTEIPEDEQAWRNEIARVFPGLPIPEYRRVEVDNLRYWGEPGSPMIYVRFKISDRAQPEDTLDFLSLMEAAKQAAARRTEPVRPPRQATVVCYADPQTGKVAARGGTPELLERVAATQELLRDYIREQGSPAAYLLDCGDAIEGFENTGSQMHTNDMSLMRQVETASDILWSFTDLLADTHSEVVVAGVGSNHCRWRAGKNPLGNAGDDWGIHMLRQLAKALKINPEAYGHVSVTWPSDHDETLALDIAGTIVGLAHGHQASRPDGVPMWWAKQVHGGQPIAHADILITGHFHSFRTQQTGRSPFSDREKRWFQAPTLDNGSDWFRAISGEDSDPGLLVMTVDANGWDNVKVLRPGT